MSATSRTHEAEQRADERALGGGPRRRRGYLNNLAGLYKAQGKLREAEPLYLLKGFG